MFTEALAQVTGRSIIAGREIQGDDGWIHGVDPVTGRKLEPAFGLLTPDQLKVALDAAENAFETYSATPPLVRSEFLERIATNIEAVGAELTARAAAETGLPAARLEGERARTVTQLRMFAEVVRQGDHLGVRIDPARPGGTPDHRMDIRQRQIPLGPVAVFGASNFPLAFSAAGGDTASALAAGCPVIVKAHNAHPGTAELAGRAIAEAASDMGLPGGVFSLVFGAGTGIGQALAADPRIKAVGFTGSQAGGTALMMTAAARPEPIPVYAEMSSINPVFVLPGSLAVNPSALADGFVQSMTLGAGQFCTSPGLIFLPNGYEADRFVEAVGGALAQCEGQTMLTAAIASACAEGIASLTAADGVDRIAEGIPGPTCNAPAPVLFSTSMETFAAAPALQDEIFGSVALLVRYGDTAELAAAARRLQGQLTVTVQCSPAESAAARELLPVVEQKAGRLIFNGWPTGVEVNHSMVHGGPFPATSDSRTTSVGSLAIDRFQRPVSYQNIPDDLLPEPLKASNPWSLTRRIDGVLEKPRG